MLLLTAFPKHSGDLYVQCEALVSLGMDVCGCTVSWSVVLNGDVCCKFLCIFANFETQMVHNFA